MRRFSIGKGQRAGFTLVELLVVVVIISMLVGLMMPALQGARRRAQAAKCTNNQHELALAIQQYDIAKQRLPGFVNLVNGRTVSWVPVLFPYLGRMDLWEGPSGTDGWRKAAGINTSAQNVRIDQLVCPGDSDATVSYPLSYVVNIGVYNDKPATEHVPDTAAGKTFQVGIFRDYSVNTTGALMMSSVKSTSQTVMLSERAESTRVWNSINNAPMNNTIDNLGFSWPNCPATTLSGVTTPSAAQTLILQDLNMMDPLPAIHGDIVIITFCDGHTESVANETLCSVYKAVP